MLALALVLLVGSSPGVALPAQTHCVITVVAQDPSGNLRTEHLGCFLDPTEAQRVAADLSNGRASLGLTSFTLGIHYDGTNGTGSSITIVGSSCGGGYWNTGPTWANRISSSYNGCQRLRHYDLPSATGASADTTGAGTTDNLPGALNNKTESVMYLSS
jgi:hypothetical protein